MLNKKTVQNLSKSIKIALFMTLFTPTWSPIPHDVWRGFFAGKISSQDVSLLVAGYTIAPCQIDDMSQPPVWYVAKKIRSINQALILQGTEKSAFNEYIRMKDSHKFEPSLCKIGGSDGLPVLKSGERVSMQTAFSDECDDAKRLQMLKKLFQHPKLVNEEDASFAKEFRILMITLGV